MVEEGEPSQYSYMSQGSAAFPFRRFSPVKLTHLHSHDNLLKTVQHGTQSLARAMKLH